MQDCTISDVRGEGHLLIDFTLSRISNGAEGVGHCARSLQALESMGGFDDEQVEKTVNTYASNDEPIPPCSCHKTIERYHAIDEV